MRRTVRMVSVFSIIVGQSPKSFALRAGPFTSLRGIHSKGSPRDETRWKAVKRLGGFQRASCNGATARRPALGSPANNSKLWSLSREAWHERAEAHRERVRALTGGSVHHDRTDPIFNFLFEYYHFKPRILMQWTPGFDVHLLEADPASQGSPLPQKAWKPDGKGGGRYCPLGWGDSRRRSLRLQRDFLAATSAKPPVLHCFGLHEWAMLYRPSWSQTDERSMHQDLPLRVTQEEINAMVNGKGGALRCTHFDAFRFFSPEARPLNAQELTRDGRTQQDQPGCVHANMDLFKWALLMWPLLPSEDLISTLELAIACRILDMRASPYDLFAYGKVSTPGRGGGGVTAACPEGAWDPRPIRIETEEGRKEYQQLQMQLYHRSMPLRRMLMRRLDRMLEAWDAAVDQHETLSAVEDRTPPPVLSQQGFNA